MPHISLADGEGIYEFWMSTTVPGGVTKDSMMKIEKVTLVLTFATRLLPCLHPELSP